MQYSTSASSGSRVAITEKRQRCMRLYDCLTNDIWSTLRNTYRVCGINTVEKFEKVVDLNHNYFYLNGNVRKCRIGDRHLRQIVMRLDLPSNYGLRLFILAGQVQKAAVADAENKVFFTTLNCTFGMPVDFKEAMVEELQK